MSKAKFTSEQQQLLRNNPYTERVTEDVLHLSILRGDSISP
jgi:hypothetical protein